MVCRTHIPRPPLSDFVEVFWQYDGLDPSHARERCLPTGTMEIVVNLRDDETRAYDRRSAYRPRKLRGPLVCGAHSGLLRPGPSHKRLPCLLRRHPDGLPCGQERSLQSPSAPGLGSETGGDPGQFSPIASLSSRVG